MIEIGLKIGKSEPLAIYIDSDKGDLDVEIGLYQECIPSNIIKELDLREPKFEKTAMYGHYGNCDFSWER